ncbi:MAG: hypothetical protein QOE15_3429 [Acidimicrobiaceae bacterium]|nr:hypothetical protein [Acidimicrobiaceae bacterium]
MGQTETATKATPDGLASAIYTLVPTRAARLRNRGADRPSRPRSPVHAERFRSEGDGDRAPFRWHRGGVTDARPSRARRSYDSTRGGCRLRFVRIMIDSKSPRRNCRPASV